MNICLALLLDSVDETEDFLSILLCQGRKFVGNVYLVVEEDQGNAISGTHCFYHSFNCMLDEIKQREPKVLVFRLAIGLARCRLAHRQRYIDDAYDVHRWRCFYDRVRNAQGKA